MEVEERKKVFIIYDNVCNLDRIHAARNPLPMAGYENLWLDTKKSIDVFHLANHKRVECRTIYHPNNIRIVHPNLRKRNTEIAEQNFAWFGRFKSELNSRPRNRQIFTTLRLIKHRNAALVERHAHFDDN